MATRGGPRGQHGSCVRTAGLAGWLPRRPEVTRPGDAGRAERPRASPCAVGLGRSVPWQQQREKGAEPALRRDWCKLPSLKIPDGRLAPVRRFIGSWGCRSVRASRSVGLATRHSSARKAVPLCRFLLSDWSAGHSSGSKPLFSLSDWSLRLPVRTATEAGASPPHHLLLAHRFVPPPMGGCRLAEAPREEV